jgi:antitoxin component of MazEF toxin-antitoxin module
MVQPLTRHGDDLVLVLDKSIIRALGITDETQVSVSVSVASDSIIVTPVRPDDNDRERRRRFEDAKRETFEKYDAVFRRLAE